MSREGITLTNKNKVANEFYKYFAQVGLKLATSTLRSSYSVNYNNSNCTSSESIFLFPITENELIYISNYLKNDGSPGNMEFC